MKKLLIILIISLTSSAIAQLPSYVPSNGLVGWWPFNGNANDESGNGNNGTVNGATLTTDRFGMVDKAYSFDGVNDLIQINAQSTIPQTSDYSVSFWFYSPTSTFNGAFLSFQSWFCKLGHDYPGLFYKDEIGNQSNTWYIQQHFNTEPSINSWHFLVLTKTGNNVSLHLDNQLVGSTVTYGFSNFNPNTLIQLGFYCCGMYYNGKLDDFGIWNRALTPTEITNLYNSVNTPAPTVSVSPSSTTICPGTPTTLTASTSGSTACSSSGLPTSLQTGLVGYWPFCGNANDASGNGNNGTVNGATLTTDRFGNSGSAYSFDGVDDNIVVQNSNSLDVNQLTLAVWYLANGNEMSIIAKNNPSNSSQYSYGLYHQFSWNTFGPSLYTSTGMGNCSNTSRYEHWGSSGLIPSNQWVFVVFTVDGLGISKTFLNGTLVESYLSPGLVSCNSASSTLRFGGPHWSNYNMFQGNIDDIAIWNRALTAAEIQQLYTTSNATYSWSPGGATTPSITVSPTTTTTYTVTATVNGQSSTSSSVVTVNTPPTITASNSSICSGQSTTLTAITSGAISMPCPNFTGSLAIGLQESYSFCGNATNTVNSNNNGSINGATLTTDAFGNVNSAYSFNGLSDYISIPGDFMNSQPSSSTSFRLRFMKNANGTFCLWNKDGSWLEAAVYITSDNKLGLFWAYPNYYSGIETISNTIQNNTWYDVVIIIADNTGQIYINNVLQNTATNSITNSAIGFSSSGSCGSGVNRFGFQKVSCSPTSFFNGKLDEFQLYNRALTTTEIQQLYTLGQTTYSWSPGGATTPSITVSPTSTTTYTCTVTANGTTCSSSQTIMVNPLPVASITPAGPVNLCQGQSVTLCAPNTPGLTYLWCNASTTSCITTNFAGNYCLVVTDANGCTSNSVSTIVNVAPLPTANAGTDFTKTCVTNPSGTLVGMTSVAGNTYSWTPATGLSSASSANPTANPTATTTYTLTATNTASGCTATDQVLVTVNTALPTVNAGLDQTICQGVSTVLNANSNGTSLSWNNGVQNNISFVPSTVGTTTYTATATGSNGCTANDNVVVTVNPLPSAAVTTNGTSSFCPGSSVQLCAPTGTGYSYLWSGNLGTTQCVTISSSATTSVTVTNAFNCSATSAPQQVTVFNNPVASAGLDATITCVQNASGAQIGDIPNPTYTYSWTPATGLSSATIGNPIANPSTTTTYTLTVVNADGCMGSDQVTVTVNNTPPTANAGLDQSICLGASLVLQGSTNGASGTWNNGVTNGISFTPSQTGTTSYTYSTVGANGCVNNDQVSVTVNALPVANSGQGAVITCVQNVNGVQLGANPISGNTYAWTPTSGLNNTNIANPTATPTASTTYTLLMSDANGCSDTAQVVVTVNNNPPIVSAGNDANVCSGDSLYLFANTTVGSTVVWNGTIQNGSNILPAQSGYQVAMATAANGCTAQDSLLVNLLQPTTSTLNEVACDEFVLNGNVYLQTGTYTQLLTNAAGCDSTITLNLTINLSPATPVVYVQNEVNLSTDVVPGQTYQWIYCSDLIPVPGATNPTFNPAANAIYAVVVTNNCGSDTSSCTTVSTIGLADHQQPEIAIYPNPNNGHFTILLPENNGSAKLEVLDLNGRIIFESILDEQANELHLESLSSGTYWLRINQQVPVPVTKY